MSGVEVPPAVARALSLIDLGAELSGVADELARDPAGVLMTLGLSGVARAAIAELPTIDRATIGEWLVGALAEGTRRDRPDLWDPDDGVLVIEEAKRSAEMLVGPW